MMRGVWANELGYCTIAKGWPVMKTVDFQGFLIGAPG